MDRDATILMLRKTPLKAKRETERRHLGRVTHERLRRKPSDGPNAAEKRYHLWLRQKGCQCGCGRAGECTHHILASIPEKRCRRDHWYAVRLSNHCHNGDRYSVHGLGSEARFAEVHGCDLVAAAIRNLEQYSEECL